MRSHAPPSSAAEHVVNNAEGEPMDVVVMLMSALALMFGQNENDGGSAPSVPREAHGAPAPGLVAGLPAAIAALGALGVLGVVRIRRSKTRSDD
jgi:hypothetical protein